MHDDRIQAGLFEQHHVAREIAFLVVVAHRMAAILHHDDRVVVAQHVGQRLHEDFSLFLGADFKRVGHGRSGRRGRALLPGDVVKLKRFDGYGGHSLAFAAPGR